MSEKNKNSESNKKKICVALALLICVAYGISLASDRLDRNSKIED